MANLYKTISSKPSPCSLVFKFIFFEFSKTNAVNNTFCHTVYYIMVNNMTKVRGIFFLFTQPSILCFQRMSVIETLHILPRLCKKS